MRILALDIATTTGWALCFDRLNSFRSGAISFPGSLGEFFHDFEKWLETALRDNGVTHVAVEEPIPMRSATNAIAMRRLYGAHAIVRKLCWKLGLPLASVNVVTWRFAFIGTTRAPKTVPKSKRSKWLKETTISECKRRGISVVGADEADAVEVLSYVCVALDAFDTDEAEALFEAA